MIRKILLTLSSVLMTLSVHAEPVPGEILLNYFQSNCRQGEWTSSALADSRALIETLRALVASEDCKSLGGAISNLNLLNSQLVSLQSLTSTQQQISSLDSKEQLLLVQLTQSNDPVVIESLNTSLRDVQLERAGLVGIQTNQEEWKGPSQLQVMTGVVQLANTTFNQIAANPLCLQKNPSILNAAAGVMSAVGAATTFVNPALGLGLTAGASILGSTLEGLRQGNLNRDIRRIADNSTAGMAYKCALETMSSKWCQMRDAQSLLNFKAQERSRRPVSDELAAAIRLNDREIPRILDFFEKIRSGVIPTNTSDAERQNHVLEREFIVRSAKAKGVALVEEKRAIYDASTDAAKLSLIFNIVKELAPGNSFSGPSSGSSSVSNPLFEVRNSGYAPFALLGVPDDASIRSDFGYYNVDSWPIANRPPGFKPTLDQVKQNFLDWIELGEQLVNQELGVVLQPDPLQTLSSAYDRLGNPWKISFIDSLDNLIRFLEKNPPKERDRAFRKVFSETLASLKEIKRIAEDAVLTQSLENETPIEEIYNLAQLKYGTVVFQTRLEMIVRVALLELFETSPQQDQVLVAQLLAANRFTETIRKMNGLESLTDIQNDIMRGQVITYDNLNSFVEIFGKNINKMLSRLKSEESRLTGKAAELKRHSRAELCFLLLGAEKARFYIYPGYCEGLKLKGNFGAPDSITITEATFREEMPLRACHYQDYFRNGKLYDLRNSKRKKK